MRFWIKIVIAFSVVVVLGFGVWAFFFRVKDDVAAYNEVCELIDYKQSLSLKEKISDLSTLDYVGNQENRKPIDDSTDARKNILNLREITMSYSIIAYYDTGFRDRKYQNMHMKGEMENALCNHEFVPYLQPKYSAEIGKICGAEALVRWITPEGKIVPPGQFIPLAENTGFVRELDKVIFMQVCDLQKNILEQGIIPVPISVNVSRQLLYDKYFADFYCNYMKQLEIPTNLVELEITESAFFEDIDLFRSTLEKLRNFGFRILMDDFGTGYSSLMMLHSVPIDIIKLDKSFIDDYEDEKGSSIIQCVLNLAKMLKLPVVAEGVETKEQYLYLKNSGCEVIQGFYFSKPIPTEEFLKIIAG